MARYGDDVRSGKFPDDGHSYKYQDCHEVDLANRPFKVRSEDGTAVETHSIIIATGATANWLGLPNELRLATSGGGVSACAICDYRIVCPAAEG